MYIYIKIKEKHDMFFFDIYIYISKKNIICIYVSVYILCIQIHICIYTHMPVSRPMAQHTANTNKFMHAERTHRVCIYTCKGVPDAMPNAAPTPHPKVMCAVCTSEREPAKHLVQASRCGRGRVRERVGRCQELPSAMSW